MEDYDIVLLKLEQEDLVELVLGKYTLKHFQGKANDFSPEK